MKKIKYALIITLFLIYGEVHAQSMNDTFSFTDVPMNYLINVTKNDVLKYGESIVDIVKLDNNDYSIEKVDSMHILLKDDSTNSYSGSFKYYIYNITAVLIDSAIVTFTKSSSNSITYFNNETNSDSIVNHLDLFQLGIFYNEVGSPRLITDTGTNFSPYNRAFWKQNNNISNASTADINGDGFIDFKDIKGIESNYLKSSGTYNPTLSPRPQTISAEINQLYSKFKGDTIYLNSDTLALEVPIFLHLDSPQSIYGLAYSYKVQYYNNTTKKYENYIYEGYTKSKPWAKDTILSKNYSDSIRLKKDIMYCKTTRQNEPVDDTLFGVVDIVVEEVLVGIPNLGDRTSLIVSIFDVVMIDNNYHFIPISPISDTIIVVHKDTSRHANIGNQNQSDISVYPTVFQNEVIVRNTKRESLNIQVFDLMGREIYQETIKNTINTIPLEKLNMGVYFLTIDEKNRVFRIIKNE